MEEDEIRVDDAENVNIDLWLENLTAYTAHKNKLLADGVELTQEVHDNLINLYMV